MLNWYIEKEVNKKEAMHEKVMNKIFIELFEFMEQI
jgi:hypothetical protein